MSSKIYLGDDFNEGVRHGEIGFSFRGDTVDYYYSALNVDRGVKSVRLVY